MQQNKFTFLGTNDSFLKMGPLQFSEAQLCKLIFMESVINGA